MSAPTDLQTRFEIYYNDLRPWHKLWRWYGLVAIIAMMFMVSMIVFSAQLQELKPYPEPIFGISFVIFTIFTILYLYTGWRAQRVRSAKQGLLQRHFRLENVTIWYNPEDTCDIEFRYKRTAYKFNCNTGMFARGYSDAMRVDDWYDWQPTFQAARDNE